MKMSIFSRLAKILLSPRQWKASLYNGFSRKVLQPSIYFQKPLLSPVLYLCAVIGSCLYIITKKTSMCEERPANKAYSRAIGKCRDLVQKIKDEVGAPGIVVGVSINGKQVWTEGLGYSDVENRVPCSSSTVMRVASISKSITMAAVAKLWEDGKLDLDKPVQHYVSYFPKKTFEGEEVTLTCRHLISHLGGIRHYDKNKLKTSADKEKEKTQKDIKENKNLELKQGSGEGNNKCKTSEFDLKEYYIKEKFEDTKSSVELFRNDPLVSKPGTKFLYSTHGWTLVSAIVESASKEQFPVHMKKLFKQLGMCHTYLDVNDALIYNRSRNYVKDKRGHLINAPYVDNSYKWAGGGFLSTVSDLLQFGNSMLYSLQYRPLGTQASVPKNLKIENSSKDSSPTENKELQMKENLAAVIVDEERETGSEQHSSILPGYLNHKTMEMMWSPIANVKGTDWYGMGWAVLPDKKHCQFCETQRFCVWHSGGAIGASSVLLILPQTCESKNSVQFQWPDPPKGIVVSILTNLQEVSLVSTAFQIALIFDTYSKYT